MTEREKFFARFENRRAEGLTDIKFCLVFGTTVTPDELCAASNRIDEAVEAGRCVKRSEWDRDPEMYQSAILAA